MSNKTISVSFFFMYKSSNLILLNATNLQDQNGIRICSSVSIFNNKKEINVFAL